MTTEARLADRSGQLTEREIHHHPRPGWRQSEVPTFALCGAVCPHGAIPRALVIPCCPLCRVILEADGRGCPAES